MAGRYYTYISVVLLTVSFTIDNRVLKYLWWFKDCYSQSSNKNKLYLRSYIIIPKLDLWLIYDDIYDDQKRYYPFTPNSAGFISTLTLF